MWLKRHTDREVIHILHNQVRQLTLLNIRQLSCIIKPQDSQCLLYLGFVLSPGPCSSLLRCPFVLSTREVRRSQRLCRTENTGPPSLGTCYRRSLDKIQSLNLGPDFPTLWELLLGGPQKSLETDDRPQTRPWDLVTNVYDRMSSTEGRYRRGVSYTGFTLCSVFIMPKEFLVL